jgi:hypothetical protein
LLGLTDTAPEQDIADCDDRQGVFVYRDGLLIPQIKPGIGCQGVRLLAAA